MNSTTGIADNSRLAFRCGGMPILTLTLNHHRASVELREQVAVPAEQLAARLQAAKQLAGVDEVLLLSTCNRTELTVVGNPKPEALVAWLAAGEHDAQPLEAASEIHYGADAVRHLFRVAAGLDSMVLGEPQILGQVKQAVATAQDAGTLCPVLDRCTQHAFAAAKAVRSGTEIGQNPVSFAYAGLRLAGRIFDDLSQQSALLIGAGEMIDLFATHLRSANLRRLHFANRTASRAEALAHKHHGASVPFDALGDYLGEADIVVSCTAAPGSLLGPEDFLAALRERKRKPLCVLDLAVPRDIAPTVDKLADVYLYDVDDLKRIIDNNQQARRDAAADGEAMLSHHVTRFMHWLESRSAGATIRALRREHAARSAEAVQRAKAALARGESPEVVLQSLSRSVSNALLHAPTKALRNATPEEQAELLTAANRLFDLDIE